MIRAPGYLVSLISFIMSELFVEAKKEAKKMFTSLTADLKKVGKLMDDLQKYEARHASFGYIPEGALLRVEETNRSYPVTAVKGMSDKAAENRRRGAKIVRLIDTKTKKVYEGSIATLANAYCVGDESLVFSDVEETNDLRASSKVATIQALLGKDDLLFLKVVKRVSMSNWDLYGVATGKDRFMYAQKSFAGIDVYDRVEQEVTGMTDADKFVRLRQARVALHNSGLVDNVKEEDCLHAPLFYIVSYK